MIAETACTMNARSTPEPCSVSVIVPTHNRKRLLERALNSIAAQTNQPDQIVVVDDGSTDGTDELIRVHYPHVVLLRTEFQNAAAARNAAVQEASGTWLAFLDSDDIWEPDHLANAMNLLSGGTDVVYFAHRYLIMEEAGKLVRIEESPLPVDAPTAGLTSDQFVVFFSQRPYFTHSAVVMKSERFREVGGFDVEQRRRHDIDLFLRVIAGRTWCYNPAVDVSLQVAERDRLSNNRPECDYYLLRCLLKNRPSYAIAEYEDLLVRIAHRAAGSAVRARNHMLLHNTLGLAGARLPWPKRVAWTLVEALLGFQALRAKGN